MGHPHREREFSRPEHFRGQITYTIHMSLKFVFAALLTSALLAPAFGKMITKDVEYPSGLTVCEGFLAYDDTFKGKRPVVLVVHDWNGIDAYEKRRCEMLASLGYVAFAVDIYGKGVRPSGAERGVQAGKYKGDRELFRERLIAGLTEAKKLFNADATKVAAIGYCFGGTGVLELARSGADVKGVVSFHGGLDTPTPLNANNIKGKVLICHGNIDPMVPPAQVEAFRKEMEDAAVDYQFIGYAGAVHAFTEPSVGNDPSTGAAYNANADRRSWDHMKLFLKEVLGS